MSEPYPRFVWYNAHGKGRNRFARFRKSFRLQSVPPEASFCLFADTAYQLFVNGSFVQFGPVRFDRRHPQYDTVDLAPWLVQGNNVVAVLVKSFGCKTFKDNSERGGFLAWEGFEDGAAGRVDFRTGADAGWKARRCRAFDSHAVKMSFALDAIDVYDQAKAESGWTEADFDDTNWDAPVELEAQTEWGRFAPRSIPFMELTETPYRVDRPVDPLAGCERVYGFSLPTPSFHQAEAIFAGRNAMALGIGTWIHSPRAQEVGVGLYWGRYFLNGEECAVSARTDRLRKNFLLKLKPGWNSFFAVESVIDDAFAFLLAVPTQAGLTVSPKRSLEEGSSLARTELLDPERLREQVDKAVPQPGDQSFDEFGGWLPVPSGAREANPGRRSLWDDYGAPFESLDAEALGSGARFPLRRYPHGFSLRLDFGQMRLVLTQLCLAGAAGAQVDLCYSGHLTEDGVGLRQNPVYTAGDRILPNAGEIQFMASQPRGARYVRLTVRGARGDVTIHSLRFLSCHYPVNRLGRFRCSDPLLNAVWEMCERSQQANMEDVFVDCSGRERGMYLRDVIIQFHNTLAAYGDTRLMGRCMELFGQSPDGTGKFRCVYPNKGDYTIADFAIEAIDGYWQYYLASGDRKRLEADWLAMLGSMDWFHQLSDEREDGLLDADWPERRGVKANYGGLHGDNKVSSDLLDKTGPNASLTFPYLLMLRRATQIARLLGRDEEALEFERRRERVGERARALLWNDEEGCFNDNLSGRTQSCHASLLAVVAEVASEQQRRSIRNRLRSRFTDVFVNGYSPEEGAYFSPAYSFFIFQGLYALNLPEVAENLMRQGWGWMLAQGAVTTPEFFEFEASRCHAWSACPMYYLSRYGLGVSFPEAPGFRVVELDIRSELDWAEGAFPIPGTGEIVEVSWRRGKGGKIEAAARVPEGVTLRCDAERVALSQLNSLSIGN